MAPKGDPPEDRHRIKIRILVVFASIFAFLAIFTSWVDRQALDTDEWVDTSGKLLEDETISNAVADYAVDELFTNVDVAEVLKERLPEDVKGLAAPVAGGVRAGAGSVAERAFQSPRVQGLWKDANRAAHTRLVDILEGDSENISSEEGKVVLDLRPIVEQLAERIGVAEQVDEIGRAHV